MKKILIFCECFYPGYKIGGIAQSMLNMVKSLNENYEFFVFTKDHEFRNYQEKLEVVSDSWVKLLSNTKVYYCSSQKVQYSFLKTLIQNINPDFVYLNGLYEIDFIIYPIIISQKLKIKIIQAPRGMLQQGALNLKPLKKKFTFQFLSFSIFTIVSVGMPQISKNMKM